MKNEIVIDGKAATLLVEGDRFEYRSEGGAAIEGQYSAAQARDGTWSILIEGRSYAVTILGAGEVSVGGRIFRVEIFDPRELRGRRRRGHHRTSIRLGSPCPGA